MAETISLFLLYAIVENSISLIFAGWRNVLFALHGDFIAKAEGAGPVPEGWDFVVVVGRFGEVVIDCEPVWLGKGVELLEGWII